MSDSVADSAMTKIGYQLYKWAWVWNRGPQLEEKLDERQRASFLSHGGAFIRNTTHFDCQRETAFWYVIKDSFNGMQDVPSKYRARVRKALETFEIRQITRDELFVNGYEVFIKAADSYRVKAKSLTFEEVKKRVMHEDGYEFWGCIHKNSGRLAAIAINQVVDNTVDYQIMKFHPDFYAKYHPSYGLIYEMNRYYLEERKVLFVNDGARSITDHSQIQSFLMQKFGFRKAYCDLEVTYNWWMGIIVKVLFPFRKMIKNYYISAILRQEAWARGLEE